MLAADKYLIRSMVSRFACLLTSHKMKKNRNNQQVLSLQKEVIAHLTATDHLARAGALPMITETTDRSTPVCMVFAHEL